MEAIYNGVNSFRVFDNRTAEFNASRRVKIDCGLDGIKYASVVSSSYFAPYTTVEIDESDLTAALTDVWYGVVQAGAVGSIPDHLHDGSEGSGGEITVSGGSGATTFLELTDTPSAYDEGKYLRSTASGTEWVTVSGAGGTISGTDDHSHTAYVPWNFGAGTISGTGDIHCNDIYTSSGTVHIGDLKLSTVLFQSDTTNGSTTFIDSSLSAHLINSFGTPTHSTTEQRIGDTSIYYAGNTDYHTVADSIDWDFGTNDFCIEYWINPSKWTIYYFGWYDGDWFAYSRFSIINYIVPTGTLAVRIGGPDDQLDSSSTITIGVWTHVSFSREGSTFRLFINGVQNDTFTSSSAINNKTVPLHIGSAGYDSEPGSQLLEGYIDELRIINGRAERTSNFTPPTTHFSVEANYNTQMLTINLAQNALIFQDLPDTLVGLSDTPDIYDDGKYLMSTGSGTEWATVSGTDDHSHVAYVPWDFGFGTISGTGDIYAGTFYGDGSNLTGVSTASGSAAWYHGSDTPTANLGVPGDYYQDDLTDDVYRRDAGLETTIWNSADKAAGISLSGGNLVATMTSNNQYDAVRSVVGVSSGKWYWEITFTHVDLTWVYIGVGTSSEILTYPGDTTEGYGYYANGGTKWNSSSSPYGSGYTEPDIIGTALDMDNGKLWWSKNGIWQIGGDPAADFNEAFSGLSGTFYAMVGLNKVTTVMTANFGASAFSYSVPSGFTAGLGDTTTGSWGVVGTLTRNFIDLDDAPSAYDEGKYLRSTVSGTEWAAAVTSGTDDHSHVAYVPWDFGSGTISGTGDIYCNDIYTSSGTVYIGDLQLSTDGVNLLVDGTVVSGADGNDAPTTFSGLTDTPVDYGTDGQYLTSTGSGIDFISLSPAPAEGNWILVATIEADNETFNESIPWDGETYPRARIESIWSDPTDEADYTRLRLNNDSGNNYSVHYMTQDGNVLGAASVLGISHARFCLGSAYVNRNIWATTDLWLKKGTYRWMNCLDNIYQTDNTGRGLSRFVGRWEDTTSTVTSIDISTTEAVTGTIKIYRWRDITDIPVAKGKQSLQVEYATTSGIYINPGTIHMKDSYYGMYELNDRTEINVSGLATDTWYYVYTNVSGSIASLDETNFTVSSGVSTIDYTNMGYYDGDDRCIGAIYSSGTSTVSHFDNSRGDIFWSSGVNIDGWLAPSTVWTPANLRIPEWYCKAYISFMLNTSSDNRTLAYRTDSSHNSHATIRQSDNSGIAPMNSVAVFASNDSTIEIQYDNTTTSTVYVRTDGFVLPDYIYTGA